MKILFLIPLLLTTSLAICQENLNEDQIQRKKKSIEYCKNHEVPTIEHLPAVESEQVVTIRNTDEILNRALVLCYMGLKSEGLEKKDLDKFEKDYDLKKHFSKEEKKFRDSKEPSQQEIVNANWRYESLHVMLWALGYIDSLKYPSEFCNVGSDVQIIISKTKEELKANAKLRSKKEILDQADLIYRLHWACRNEGLKGNKAPSNLDPSIVYERHYSLNWLINYMKQDWDDISTNT